MPSGPEGDQEISEHTLMHPKYKTTGFYFSSLSLFSFLSPFFCEDFFFFSRFFHFQVNTDTYSGVPFLASFFVLLFIAHVMNWFPLSHSIQGVLGQEWVWNFLLTQLQLLSKPKCVFHQ